MCESAYNADLYITFVNTHRFNNKFKAHLISPCWPASPGYDNKTLGQQIAHGAKKGS